MPTFRTPTFAVTLPDGDFLDRGSRVDVRPAGGTRGEIRRVRLESRPVVSLG
jgi:hypothetical protein